MVTAGVIVDPESVPLLQSLGVDDSKRSPTKKSPAWPRRFARFVSGSTKSCRSTRRSTTSCTAR
ncbi:hypothetical protein JJB07_05320 [Tumebacillus sp. ITR2]|uniref:Uncharacterized protein n=1 Tax=Tumebacillus amylolyticus TaxID=2801339 RepID=A0ABS1J8U8_9BACL|nr:hypothetical protein [Tumebacillus amylolyticus]